MKPYPKYKDSGVEWIGEVPEGWEVKKLKYSDKVIMGQSPSSDDYNDLNVGFPFLQGNADFTSLYPNPRIWCETANKYAEKNDVLLSVRAPIGAVNIADQKYGIGRGLCAIRSIQSLPVLLFHFALSLNSELERIGTGSTYTAISVIDVENMFIPNIPPAEQKSIAAYLDRKTSQIDNLISKKQKLIELLKEERSAIINQAVTKGLNPDAQMKDSGIEWLGEIPAHWEVKKLKWLAKIRLSNIDKKSKEGELEVELCNYVDVYYNDNITSDIEFMKATARQDQIDILSLAEGDVLITKDSESPDDIAVPTFVPASLSGVVCGYHLAHVRPYQKHANGNYLFWSFGTHGISDQFEISANGVTRFGIGKQAIENSVFLSPPIEEQEGISKFIEMETTKIDQTTCKTEKQIELLKEFRTALISEVVTGKIDVRDGGSNG